MRIQFVVIAALCLPAAPDVRAQGCSDAGFCTAGALQHGLPAGDSARESSIGISLTTGSSDQGVIVTVPQLEWKQRLPYRLLFELKASWYFASGNLGTTSGIGDPVVTVSRSWHRAGDWSSFATAGVRVSLTDAGKADASGKPLPMTYQRGLGTTDAILGFGAQFRDWLTLSAGYQQPLVHYNSNGYLRDAYPLESEAYRSYFSSRKLRRSGDVLLRADATLMRRSWALSGGPLLIYHLGDDHIDALNGDRVAVAGSGGVTLNLAGRVTMRSGASRWEIGGGAPVIVRKQRPDGLTRHWLISLRYERTLR